MYDFLTPEGLTELAASDDAGARHAAEDIRELSRRLLLHEMRAHGRALFNDDTADDIPYILWRAVEEGPKTLSEDAVTELLRLAEACDGWWLFGGIREYPEFVELAGWRETYAEVSRA